MIAPGQFWRRPKANQGRKKEAVDRVLCSSFQDVEVGVGRSRQCSPCDPLDDNSLSATRNAVYYEETGKQLKSRGAPPPGALWPGNRPPDGHIVLVPKFTAQGAQTTLLKQWWLRAGAALANCIRRGQRMAIARCTIKSGANRGTIALFMCAHPPPSRL